MSLDIKFDIKKKKRKKHNFLFILCGVIKRRSGILLNALRFLGVAPGGTNQKFSDINSLSANSVAIVS